MSDETTFWGVTIISVILFIYGISIIGEQVNLPGRLAKIEQLRIDASHTKIGNNEDVIGQVTQWNQTIRSKQAYNKKWWAAITIPNEWDDVKLIEIPE